MVTDHPGTASGWIPFPLVPTRQVVGAVDRNGLGYLQLVSLAPHLRAAWAGRASSCQILGQVNSFLSWLLL